MSAARPKKLASGPESEPQDGSVSGPSPVCAESPTSGSALPPAWSAFSGRALWISLALIAANWVVYAAVWHHNFVNLDDPAYVSANPIVFGGLTWRGVAWAFTTGYFSNWHPLTWLSHMLDVQAYGLSAGPHHLTNVLLHIANTLLLFGLLHRMTGALGRSAFVAGLFAVHPLHVESVAWVAERKDVLSTLFWMLTLWGYVSYVRQPRRDRYRVVLLLFALGLMAKPMLVTLPFVLLLLDVWPLGRVALRADSSGRLGWASLREQRSVGLQLVREKLPLFALSVASSVVTVVVQQHWGAVRGLDALPVSRRLANALVSYAAYIGKMLWPTPLAAFYPYPQSIPGWWVVGAILLLIGVSVVVIRAGRRFPYLPVGWLWYLGTLVPVIGLVQAGGQARADRYTYVPLIGLFLMVAWWIPDLLARWPYRSIALPTAAGLVILACTITARGQVQYWQSSITLWEHTLKVTNENYFAHFFFGATQGDRGRLPEAIAHFSEAMRLKPDFAPAHNSLGAVLENQGRVSEAIAHYSEAVRLKPDYAEAHTNLGAVLENQGRVSDAIAHYSEAVRLKPDFALAHNNLGNALARQGKVSEAIAHYAEAVRLEPTYADAYNNLGNALANQGRMGEASAHYAEAVRLEPDFALAHNNLGLALANQGKVSEAIAHYAEALRLKPDYAEAHNNLGVALVNQGKVSEAIAHYAEALRLEPDFVLAHNNLGFALASQGSVEKAIHEFREALRINPENQVARSALGEVTSRGKRSGLGTP